MEALRRKDDIAMAELKRDIKEINTSQKELTKKLVEHIETNETAHITIQELLKKHDIQINGDVDLGVKGIRAENQEIKESIKPVLSILSNAKILWGVFSVMGISTLKDLWEWIRPFAEFLIQKAQAGN